MSAPRATNRDVKEQLEEHVARAPSLSPAQATERTLSPALSSDDVQEVQPGDAAAGASHYIFRRNRIQAEDEDRLFDKTLRKYRLKIKAQAVASDTREGRENIIVHERLLSIVKMVEQSKKINDINRIHKRHSKDALTTAHEMLVRELTEYERCAKRIINLKVRAGIRNKVIGPHRKDVRDIEDAMKWCDQLELDISDELQRRKAVHVSDD